ncbi:MAG: RidA family protein [Cohaesibacteraceae bacterium]
MTRRLISSGSPFEHQAGYSRAVVDGDYVHVAGTTGYDYATMTMPEAIKDQARNALATIASVLEEAGTSLDQLVRVHYYLTNREHADGLFAITGEVLGDIRPAATLLICDLLNEEMLVEIEATAKLPK